MHIIERRRRARYSRDAGLMPFRNPSPFGPVNHVSFCSTDRMFHVIFRYSPIPGDGRYLEIVHKIRSVPQKDHYEPVSHLANSVPQMCTEDRRDIISMWAMGDIDLDDMVGIVESVPELQAGWVRPEVGKFKEIAGLDKSDLPFLDRDWNKKERDAWYKGAWLSGKGGTLELAVDVPNDVLGDIAEKIRREATEISICRQDDETRIRFLWSAPRPGFEDTRKHVRNLMDGLPGVLQGAIPRRPRLSFAAGNRTPRCPARIYGRSHSFPSSRLNFCGGRLRRGATLIVF